MVPRSGDFHHIWPLCVRGGGLCWGPDSRSLWSTALRARLVCRSRQAAGTRLSLGCWPVAVLGFGLRLCAGRGSPRGRDGALASPLGGCCTGATHTQGLLHLLQAPRTSRSHRTPSGPAGRQGPDPHPLTPLCSLCPDSVFGLFGTLGETPDVPGILPRAVLTMTRIKGEDEKMDRQPRRPWCQLLPPLPAP